MAGTRMSTTVLHDELVDRLRNRSTPIRAPPDGGCSGAGRFGVWCRFAQGATQIGDDQARSWMVAGRSGRGSTPARIASHVDQRHDGFSSTRT